MSVEYGKRMFEGSEFHVAATVSKKTRRARLVSVLGRISRLASNDHRGWTGTVAWIKSLRYAGTENDGILNISNNAMVTCCLEQAERTGICLTSMLTDNSSQVVLHLLQYVYSCSWRTEQDGIAVVQPGAMTLQATVFVRSSVSRLHMWCRAL